MAKEADTPQNPLILPFFRLQEAFLRADDENDYYFEREEGALFYLDLTRSQEEIEMFEKEISSNPDRYIPIPKMTHFETKRMMESFINDKIFDIDNRGKLADALDKQGGTDNFLQEIMGMEHEEEKWKKFSQMRIRVLSILFLRGLNARFVFEEDLDQSKSLLEKVKMHLYSTRPPADVAAARKALEAKADTYWQVASINPSPRRGRPRKKQDVEETEPEYTIDRYVKVSFDMRAFLYVPDPENISGLQPGERIAGGTLRGAGSEKAGETIAKLSQRLEALQKMTTIRMEPPSETFESLSVKKPVVTAQKSEGGIFGLFKGALPSRKKEAKKAFGPKKAEEKKSLKVTQIKKGDKK